MLQVKNNRLQELLPVILEKLRVVLPLEKGRDFTIPHGVKVGWNYGMAGFNKQGELTDNPNGLVSWSKHLKLDRTPPKRLTTFDAILNSPLTR